MTKVESRSEDEIFSQLERLCTSPGYAHAIAFFCFRDNIIKYVDQMKIEDVLRQYSSERLVRTEISTLIGLTLKGEFDIEIPSPKIFQYYIDETEKLLFELHQSMMQPIFNLLDPSKLGDANFNPFAHGYALRESIFYAGEAAYNFQYRDLFYEKYKNDNDWFVRNKGYSIQQANTIVKAISNVQNKNIWEILLGMINKSPIEWTLLPGYSFTINEIVIESGEDKSTVNSFIESFVIPDERSGSAFSNLSDFNPSNAYPIIQLNETEHLLFQNYSLVEALYETPFYWLIKDMAYVNEAQKNRGIFTENFSKESLIKVFGENRVFTNIIIYDKKVIVGEIDVLVIFADRAIVLQAKSKKLTIEARKGNDNSLKDDFKKAVQDAYDQAFLSANFLNDNNYKLIDSNGNELDIPRKYKEIYPLCVVSDHYPALNFQARQFLTYQTTKTIMPPFVMDVFFLDVITEMLQTPLYFLSYINRRVQYREKVLSNQELTILSYHLKKNLWIEGDNLMMILEDDFGADLDLAMMTRRDNAPGNKTPEGILTKYQNTYFGQIIKQIGKRDDPGTIELGFMMLKLGEESVNELNYGIPKLIRLFMMDGKTHDLTMGINDGATGLTIHCTEDKYVVAKNNLIDHCLRRKYTEKASTWFGLCISPIDSQIRFGVNFDFDWKQSKRMDELTKGLSKPQARISKKRHRHHRKNSQKKD